MSSEPYDFEEQLEFGTKWENEVKDRLESVMLSLSMQSISFDEKPEMQLAGIDHIVSKDSPAIDVKTCDHKYSNSKYVPIETMSVEEKDKPGWFFDSEADLVVFVYPNKAKTNLYKSGYMMPLKTGLRDWFRQTISEYSRKRIPNNGKYGEYHTAIRLVPKSDIPDEYLVEFDPRLPTDKETPQSDITEWMGRE